MRIIIFILLLTPFAIKAQTHSYTNEVLTITWPESKIPKIKISASGSGKDTLYAFCFTENKKSVRFTILSFQGISGPRYLIELFAASEKKRDIHDDVTTYCLNGRLDIDWVMDKLSLHANLDNGISGSVTLSHSDIQKLLKL